MSIKQLRIKIEHNGAANSPDNFTLFADNITPFGFVGCWDLWREVTGKIILHSRATQYEVRRGATCVKWPV
jgi:hypothetical protein